MDSYEATRIVFSRLQSLDPDNASKIMGYIFLHDAAEDHLLRLSLGPDSLLLDLSLEAKSFIPKLTKSPSSSPSYASVLNSGGSSAAEVTGVASTPPASVGDEHYENLHDHVSFLGEPASRAEGLLLHRRSLSVPPVGANVGGSCHYYARGFCKNGSSCRFFHNELLAGGAGDLLGLGSLRLGQLSEFDQCGDLMNTRPATVTGFSVTPNNNNINASLPYNKSFNFLLQQQADIHQRSSGSFGMNGLVNPSARQIYLTFPADSTFTEEDVSNYFSIYGPVQDVRIPYQQKRMFGFVTFLYPETVKLILAKGNPHFVCDSRVLVKPYKEKGKVAEKKQLQHQHLHMERGEYSISPCSSPCGVDSRDPFDLSFGGGRMYFNNQEMLLKKKLDVEAQTNFRQALELQNRRLLSLQLQDLKNHQHYNHPHRYHHFQHDLANLSPLSSPTIPRSPNFQISNHHLQDPASQGVVSETDSASRDFLQGKNDESSKLSMEPDNNDSLEHILPDNLFGSPKKSALDQPTMFTASCTETDQSRVQLDMPMFPSSGLESVFLTKSPALSVESSVNSVLLQLPRLSPSHGTIGR
ncbi:hypothetical protein SAY86_026621 [Trapa natans]|uniref:Uncharacterized protein n=1 Tax=Trapa natans TaxID=22666 RepID=A0AAN7KK31_TRANT|nr:hypothetical protein SAY86_026621 [Trapa natans]